MKSIHLVIMVSLGLILGIGGTLFWKSQDSIKLNTPITANHLEAKTMYHCAMHPHYISDKPGDCPLCGMKLVPFQADLQPGGKGGHGSLGGNGVLIDPTTVQNMGVKTELVRRHEFKTEIRTSGKIKVDESRLTQVTSRVMGYVQRLRVNTNGQKVHSGQTLFDLYSPDLVSAQEELLQALQYSKGTAGSVTNGAGDLVESSRRRLLNWGVSQSDIDALEKKGKTMNTLAIAAPNSGIVLEKFVVEGQNIMPGTELFKIADLSRVWVVADIYQRDLGIAKVGADAEVTLAFLPGKPFHGKVNFISPVLDPNTQTAQMRIELQNTSALDLKPEMFATVRITSEARLDILAIPEQSIIRSGLRNIAIVALGGGYFEPRDIELGTSDGVNVEVVKGLEEGESLVISSQFLIDSESNLKAAVQQMTIPGAVSPVNQGK